MMHADYDGAQETGCFVTSSNETLLGIATANSISNRSQPAPLRPRFVRKSPGTAFVLSAARFGNERVRFGKKFLRIPIVPDSARFYAAELKELFWSGEIRNTLRLGLLPCWQMLPP